MLSLADRKTNGIIDASPGLAGQWDIPVFLCFPASNRFSQLPWGRLGSHGSRSYTANVMRKRTLHLSPCR